MDGSNVEKSNVEIKGDVGWGTLKAKIASRRCCFQRCWTTTSVRKIRFGSSMCLSKDWTFRGWDFKRRSRRIPDGRPMILERSFTAVCVRVSESDALESAVRNRSRAQRGGDVADAQA